MEISKEYKEMVIEEIYSMPEEYLPSIFQIIQSLKSIGKKKKYKKSSSERLLEMAGSLENPDNLNVKDFKNIKDIEIQIIS